MLRGQILRKACVYLDCKDPATIKRAIREAIRRWHPDKFKQKLGPRILKTEFSEVMERVTYVAQALNNFGHGK